MESRIVFENQVGSFFAAIKKGQCAGTDRRKADVEDLHKEWVKSGCPSNFRLSYVRGECTGRVMDTAARREHLERLRDPSRASYRRALGELELLRRKLHSPRIESRA